MPEYAHRERERCDERERLLWRRREEMRNKENKERERVKFIGKNDIVAPLGEIHGNLPLFRK